MHQKFLALTDRTRKVEALIVGTGLIDGRPGLPAAVQSLMDEATAAS